MIALAQDCTCEVCGYVLSFKEFDEHRKSGQWHVICDGCSERIGGEKENEVLAELEADRDLTGSIH